MNPGNMVLMATKIIPYPVNVLWMTMYTLAQVIRIRKETTYYSLRKYYSISYLSGGRLHSDS